MVLRRVGVWSAARLYGGICAAIGLIIGTVFAFVAIAGAFGPLAGLEGADSGFASRAFGALFGVGAIIAAPLFYGVFGVIGGALGAALYNLFAGLFGGIEVELQ